MRFMRQKDRYRKRSKNHTKIPGMIEIRYLDENGNVNFEWRKNRSGSNVESGIYEMMKFFKEKMAIDIVSYLESSKQNINIQTKPNTLYTKKEGDTTNGNTDK